MCLGGVAVAMIALGCLYLVSGLAAPAWAVALLGVSWFALAVAAVRLARARSLLVPAVPPVAAGVWVAVLIAGELLGRQA